MSDSLMTTYNRLPVTCVRGEGAWLWDTVGRRYLDALSGIAVTGLGHSHPEVTRQLGEQIASLIHTSNLYGIANQQALGDRLTQAAGMERAFFCNSGAEANEAAIKLARLHGRRRGVERPHILVMEGSFHGRTLATLSATGNRKIQQGFEPRVEGFIHVPYGEIGPLEALAATRPTIVAVLVEPIQGEGGINIPPKDYLNQLRSLCDSRQWLLMLDEIQTGMGRSGRMFAHQHQGVVPDVMTLAKGLGNGVPIGCCLAQGEAASLFGPGSHGSTFGGNPLACRAGLSVLEVLERDGLLERATELGIRIRSGLGARLAGQTGVKDIRGLGLLIGIELDRPCAELVARALDAGLLINVTAERVIRLLPPLIYSDAEADQLVDVLGGLIESFLQ